MLNDIPAHVARRNRQRSIAISDDMLKEIRNVTKGCISISGFIRMAVMKELEKVKKTNL